MNEKKKNYIVLLEWVNVSTYLLLLKHFKFGKIK